MRLRFFSTTASVTSRVLLVAVLGTTGLVLSAPASQAADPCTDAGGSPHTTAAGEVSCTFSTTGSYTFTPPADATNIRLTAYGARGGGAETGSGGLGAYAFGNFGDALAGVPLTFISPGAGQRSGVAQNTSPRLGRGGYPDGGDAGYVYSVSSNSFAAGGGGSARVRSADGALIVAGGGGGNSSGVGGNAGAAGGRGCDPYCGYGGGAGTVNGPGSGGKGASVSLPCPIPPDGRDGDYDGLGYGGDGAIGSFSAVGGAGGGGGGGYHGGGGGGTGAKCSDGSGGGGGGGGGSSYVAPSATDVTIMDGPSAPNPNLPNGAVAITYVVPPTVTSVTAPAQLKGSPFVVTFSRPVKGVSTDAVSVVKVGPTNIAGDVTCRDESNAAVSCLIGPVTTTRFTPKGPLIAGEFYSISVNQSTSDIVAFDNDLPVKPSQTSVRAQTALTAFDYPVTYKWARVASAKALGGSYVRDGSGGATATATLKLASASEASLVLWRGPSQGIADISVTTQAGSPVFSYTIDTYRTRSGQLNASLGTLTVGTYKVTVTTTGNKNAASTGTFVGVDGVIANGKTTATPKLVAMWPNYPGEYAYDYTKGTSVSLKFRGTGIEWTALVGPNNGYAKVTIDGVVVDAARDLYAPGYAYQTFTYDGLSENGYHTIVITTLGTKQAASSDTVVTIKALTVL